MFSHHIREMKKTKLRLREKALHEEETRINHKELDENEDREDRSGHIDTSQSSRNNVDRNGRPRESL